MCPDKYKILLKQFIKDLNKNFKNPHFHEIRKAQYYKDV